MILAAAVLEKKSYITSSMGRDWASLEVAQGKEHSCYQRSKNVMSGAKDECEFKIWRAKWDHWVQQSAVILDLDYK